MHAFHLSFFTLGIILNGSNFLSRPSIWAFISFVAFPGFLFRIVANFFRLIACANMTLKSSSMQS